MKKINISEVFPKSPGLVITPDGKAIVMENENHANFFSQIIESELNTTIKENELNILITILLKEFHYLPYMGCSSGDRKFLGGHLLIDDLKKLNEEQLQAAIWLYSNITSEYSMDIIKLGFDKENDVLISTGEIFEEILERNEGKIKQI